MQDSHDRVGGNSNSHNSNGIGGNGNNYNKTHSQKNKRFSWVKRLITPGTETEAQHMSSKPVVRFARDNKNTKNARNDQSNTGGTVKRPIFPKYHSDINTDSSSGASSIINNNNNNNNNNTRNNRFLYPLNDITSIENDEMVSYISSSTSMRVKQNQERCFYTSNHHNLDDDDYDEEEDNNNNNNNDNNENTTTTNNNNNMDTITMTSITPLYRQDSNDSTSVSISNSNYIMRPIQSPISFDHSDVISGSGSGSGSNHFHIIASPQSIAHSLPNSIISHNKPVSLFHSYYNQHLQVSGDNNSILSGSTYDDNLSTKPLLSLSSDEEIDDGNNTASTINNNNNNHPRHLTNTIIPHEDRESKYPNSFISTRSVRSVRSTKSTKSTKSNKSNRSAVTSYSVLTSPALTTINSGSTAATSYTTHTNYTTYTNAAATASSVITLASSSRRVGSSSQSIT